MANRNQLTGKDLPASVAQKGPLKRIVASILVIVLLLCALTAKLLLDARVAAQRQATQVAERLAATLKVEIARTIESYNLSMEAVVENLKYPEVRSVSPEMRQALLFDRSATAKHLHAITLVDENGKVQLDSRSPFPKHLDRSTRDYFTAQRADPGLGLYISAPFLTPETHKQIIAISRRVSSEDGKFAGVVVGAIDISYFQDLFRNALLGLDGNVTLLRTDGRLLTRWPYKSQMFGMDLKGSDLFKHYPASKSGTFETNNVTDGVQRLVTYSQIGDLPLIVGVGQSTNEVYAQWRRYALWFCTFLALLFAVSTLLVFYLIREIRRREELEGVLVALADEDALTGIANRRRFDRVLEREWQRAKREQSLITLVMIDIDEFKALNDTRGHQAGDNVLRALGQAIKFYTRRGTDLTARLGGDEFAILLPAATLYGARQIAEDVRFRFAELCAGNGSAGPTLSIGIATMMPAPADEPSTIVTIADQAAYQAKRNGRNRIEVVSNIALAGSARLAAA